MKWLFVLFSMLTQQAFSQFNSAKISINLKGEYLSELKDSAFEVIVVSAGFLKTYHLKNREVQNVDSIPANNLLVLVSCLKKYDSLNVVKEFNTDTSMQFNSSHLIKLEIPFPPECIYNKNIKTKKCTVCYKTDMVIPIFYKVPYLKYYKNDPIVESFPGTQTSLETCSPTWYCKRDKVEF